MEISSFPFLSDDYFSHLYSTPYPELQTPSSPTAQTSWRKRLSEDNESDNYDHAIENVNVNVKEKGIKEILATLLMFDEDDIQDQHHCVMSTQEDATMRGYYDQVHSHCSEVDSAEVKQRASKRARLVSTTASANAATSTVAVGGADSVSEVGSAQPTHQRRLWVKDRSKDWWDKCSHPDFPEEEFKKGFRMSKGTFDMICDELEPIITKKDTMLRAAIPVRQRVAVCIWRLATGEPLRLVSKRFGLGISTCHKLVLEVCLAIKTALMPKFLQWPDEARLDRIKKGFESLSGIPDVGGSMYTTHIPIIAPKVSVAAYFNKRHTERNQKTSYSITVQGVVDPNGVFTDVCIGWPGSMPDDQVLEKSALFQRANRGLLNNVWMVGNSSYPLMDWVLAPYTHSNLTWTQHAFNEKIGEIQKTAKGAFSRLKGRWGCLQKRTEVKLQDLPVVLGACCVLHNICEMRNEGIDPELEASFELFDDEMVPENAVRSVAAVQHRDNIAHNLLHHGLGGTSFL